MSLYELMGGQDACRQLVIAFYARVARDPVLRPLYPPTLKFQCPIESLTLFLSQFLGDTGEYSRHRFHMSLREAHARFKIGQEEREAWLHNMWMALDEIHVEEPARCSLRNLFARSSMFLVNHPGPIAEVDDLSIEASQADVHQEAEWRWTRQRALEELIRAARQGEAQRVLALVGGPLVQTYLQQDRAAMAGLLAILGDSDSADLRNYVHQQLVAAPRLVKERYAAGRTLLHDAAGAWSLAFTALLLRLGADSNAEDYAGHTALYFAGNSVGATKSGGSVVHLLVHAGAEVNAQGGVKQCSPLHMAARRGNVQVGAALLECGANLEARDSLGDTPLRRAVNCCQLEMAGLLLSWGADVRSQGSRGLTPEQAARGVGMKQLLQSAPKAGASA